MFEIIGIPKINPNQKKQFPKLVPLNFLFKTKFFPESLICYLHFLLKKN